MRPLLPVVTGRHCQLLCVSFSISTVNRFWGVHWILAVLEAKIKSAKIKDTHIHIFEELLHKKMKDLSRAWWISCEGRQTKPTPLRPNSPLAVEPTKTTSFLPWAPANVRPFSTVKTWDRQFQVIRFVENRALSSSEQMSAPHGSPDSPYGSQSHRTGRKWRSRKPESLRYNHSPIFRAHNSVLDPVDSPLSWITIYLLWFTAIRDWGDI